jgi:hypothetical protein
MNTKRLVPVVIAASAGALLLTGCSSVSRCISATGPHAATGGPQATPTTTARGNTHLIDYTDNDGTKSTVILTGAIGDYGQAVSIYPNGKPDPDHNSQLNLALTHGSFRLSIKELDKQIVSAFSHFPSNTTTCSGNVTAAGSAPIVAGSGTGAYKGISGAFDMTVTIAEVDSTKPKCDGSSAFLAQVIFMTGSGAVSLR